MTGETMQISMPRVSVLMTIYNAEPFLRDSINSLIAQSFSDWELIAVENGSTDASPSILSEYSDRRIRVFTLSKNIGRTPALRYAFDQARGDYIAVLDADDISFPERLIRQVAFLDQHPDVGLVGSWTQFIDEHGKVFAELKPPTNQNELRDCLGWINPIVNSSAMYRRQLALKVGGYPEDLVHAQDFGLTLALAQCSMVAMIGDFLCQFRVFSASMTRSRKYRIIVAREELMLFQRAANLLQFCSNARRLNLRAQAIRKIKLGISLMTDGSMLPGLKLMLHGLVDEPSVLWRNGHVSRFFCGCTSYYSERKITMCGGPSDKRSVRS